ncbi:MAG: N-acetyltransferase, partial [Candidatus Bipolaricaulis sp.]|nr:N-acetyltransferase [Candidatus Bipolaricaulis sp.]
DRAFGRGVEGAVVDELRETCPTSLSLVAEEGGQIVGHALFSPIRIECNGSVVLEGMGLGPLAVAPERQRCGIGSMLVRAGLNTVRDRGCPFVLVIGHPAYYPKFGFTPASARGLVPQWEGIPDEAFMVLVLDERAMAGVPGVASYRSEFDPVSRRRLLRRLPRFSAARF